MSHSCHCGLSSQCQLGVFWRGVHDALIPCSGLVLRCPAAAPRLSTASALTLSCTASQHQRPRQSSPGHVLPPPSSPPPPLLPPLPPPLPCCVNYTDAVGPLRGSAASSKLTLCYPHHSLLSLQHEGCTLLTWPWTKSMAHGRMGSLRYQRMPSA